MGFFSLRIYVRTFIGENWGMDDTILIISIVGSHSYFSLFAAPCTWCDFSSDTLFHRILHIGFLVVKFSAGRHMSNILPEELLVRHLGVTAHPGKNYTWNLLSQRYWWPQITDDMANIV